MKKLMKLNDIYINLKKTLDLKINKSFLSTVHDLNEEQNIDSIKNNLDKINLKNKKNIILEKQSSDIFDGVNNTKKQESINLKKIIKNSKKITYIISDFIGNLHFNFKNKNKLFKISSFIILFFSILLLDKIIVQNLVSSGINNLYNLKYISNISEAETNLSKAKTKFNVANILFIPFKLIPEQNLVNANNGILVLNNISGLGLESIEFYKDNINYIKNKKITDIYFANLLENSKPFFLNNQNKLNKILEKLNKIKLDFNNEENSNYIKLESLKTNLNLVQNKLNIVNSNFETFLNILGKNKSKKYFIVFQNNDEIRPTGGFMGSAGIIEIFAGKIKSFEKRDIYAYEWDSKKNYTGSVKGPTGIDLLSKRLGLRDANAFINFNTSSKSINYFMKKAGYNLDGVIYINQKIILDILDITGEIDFGKYNSKINSKNFSEIISLLVEAKVSKKSTLDTPKQVLFDFSEKLKKKIIQNKKYLEIIKVILNNIKTRDLVIYNFDKKENGLLKKLELNGYFNYTKQTDFNYPFFISIGGNKSDRYIKRKYVKSVEILENENNNLCNIKTNIEIILENTFNKEDKQRIINTMKKFRITPTEDLINIAGNGLNQNFTKIVIPKNAIIDKKITNKYGNTVINHGEYKTVEKLLKTKSGHKSYMTFSYKLENINCEKQNIKIYKQAGIYNYDLRFGYLNHFNHNSETLKLDGLKQDFYYNSLK